MDRKRESDRSCPLTGRMVGKHPADEEEWLLLGELLYADGKMTEALNKFNTVLRLNPDHRKAANYVVMINNILGYYCKDMFNP